MRISKLLLLCLCCVLLVPALFGQTANPAAKPGILGYLDPQTGAFRPVPLASEDAIESAASTTFGGTITVTLTITVKTTTLAAFNCEIDASVTDAITTSPHTYMESVTGPATGSGTTRTCKLSIPYSWSLATQSTDTMSVNYLVIGTGSGAVTGRTSGLTPLSTQKVPANGAITTLSASVTL
jgi:lysozyme family protein